MRRPLVIAALVIVAAACGGSDDDTGGVATLEDAAAGAADTVATLGESPEQEEAVTQEEALFAFAACMRDNGIDIEDPTVDADGNLRLGNVRPGGGPGAEGADREAARAAFAECGRELEGVALGFRGRDADQTEREDTLLAFAACMRDNGYDMPDPDFSGAPGQGGGPFGEIDRTDPAFVAAQEACGGLLAGFGRGPGGGPGEGG